MRTKRDWGGLLASPLRNWRSFAGRAPRAEFWLFTGWVSAIGLVVEVAARLAAAPDAPQSYPASDPRHWLPPGTLTAAKWQLGWLALVAVPSWSLTVRRLHDTGRSGARLAWLALPVFGMLPVLWWCLRRGDEKPNAYGPAPHGTPRGARR